MRKKVGLGILISLAASSFFLFLEPASLIASYSSIVRLEICRKDTGAEINNLIKMKNN